MKLVPCCNLLCTCVVVCPQKQQIGCLSTLLKRVKATVFCLDLFFEFILYTVATLWPTHNPVCLTWSPDLHTRKGEMDKRQCAVSWLFFKVFMYLYQRELSLHLIWSVPFWVFSPLVLQDSTKVNPVGACRNLIHAKQITVPFHNLSILWWDCVLLFLVCFSGWIHSLEYKRTLNLID